MHDVGGIVWVVLVIIGVVSSISKNAKKKAPTQQAASWPTPVQQPASWQAQLQPATPWQPETQQEGVPLGLSSEALPAGSRRALRTSFEPVMPPIPSSSVPASPMVVEAIVPPEQLAAPTPPTAPESPVGASPLLPQRPRGTGVLRGLFEDRRSLVRAIVAAEVLGPPLALKESSLWSPRSDPST